MFIQDLKYALRSLTRRPGFSLLVILVLALGIGPVTIILSIANGVLLRPLPYEGSERLIYVATSDEGIYRGVSYPNYLSYLEQADFLEAMAIASYRYSLNLTGQGDPERVVVNMISPSFFDMLNGKPLLGRLFLPNENVVPGGHPVAVISHRLWQRAYAGDPEIVNKVVQLNGYDFTVVGVLSEDFMDFVPGVTNSLEGADVYVPAMMAAVIQRPGFIEDRGLHWLQVVGRLKPGIQVGQARAKMEAIFSHLIQSFPSANEGCSIIVKPLRESRRNFEDLRYAIVALLVGAVFLMLIVSVNIANLMTLRAFERQSEMALKMSLGANRRLLARQLLVEGSILSLLGGALGAFMAFFLIRFFTTIVDREFRMPPFVHIAVDPEVLAVVTLIAVVNGVLFGLAPVLSIRQGNLWSSLQASRRTSFGTAHRYIRNSLTIAEVALSVIFLAGAGLSVKSYGKVLEAEVGFLDDDMVIGRFDLPTSKYTDAETSQVFFRNAAAQAQLVPGVDYAGIWGPGVPGYNSYLMRFTPEGRSLEDDSERILAFEHYVTPGLLSETGVPLLQGRYFRPGDDAESHFVTIVSKTIAETAWPNQDPIGKRIWRGAPHNAWLEVVGVVDNVRHRGRLDDLSDNTMDVFFSVYQLRMRYGTFVMKADLSRSEVEQRMREVVRAADSEIPLFDVQSVAERKADEEAGVRLNSMLMIFYALFTMLLAVMGLYSVIAYSVRPRTHEIGIRMALGAKAADVVKTVVGEAMVLVAVGLGLGIVGGLALARVFTDMFFGIEAANPAVFLGVTLLFVAVAAIASFVPAREAVKLDPAQAIHYE